MGRRKLGPDHAVGKKSPIYDDFMPEVAEATNRLRAAPGNRQFIMTICGLLDPTTATLGEALTPSRDRRPSNCVLDIYGLYAAQFGRYRLATTFWAPDLQGLLRH